MSRDACMMSMRRKIKGKSPEEIRGMKREELEQPVSIQDFEVHSFLKFYFYVKFLKQKELSLLS